MTILGLSFYYHDAAAALLSDGRIIAAAEEERFSRKKHDSGFPCRAIDFCLTHAKIKPHDIDYVVFYEKPFRKFHRILLSSLATYPLSYRSFREAMRLWLTKKLWLKQDIASYLEIDPSRILFTEHHSSHAASCFYPSPFDKAAILTIDGVGEWTTASYGVGEGHTITLIKELRFPRSLGLLYSAFTAFLGFEVNEGEWKVMGLAPYGKPRYVNKVRKLIIPHKDGSFDLDFSYFSYQYSDTRSYSNKFIKLFGNPIDPAQSHRITPYSADIAASIQTVTEELLITMTRYIQKETGLSNLCLSGGVALNSVANYKILRQSGFTNIYIQPAAGDSGGALGAALYVYHQILGHKKRSTLKHAYFGEKFSNNTIKSFLRSEKIHYTYMPIKSLVSYIADKISKNFVIGWMQGRFEWGPRALGNRSILADARNPHMKDIINAKVKFREAFRPFAPSVLGDHADEVFELSEVSKTIALPHHYPFRFMLYVIPVKKQWRKRVPAINHADNTARPQFVYKSDNSLYYSLLDQYYKKTKVPLVLNTSFNLRGEPIVNSPSDAYSTFIRSGIDILVMGNYIIEKSIST